MSEKGAAPHHELFTELLHLRDETRASQDIHLQTLFVRCFRKSKVYQTANAGSESLNEAFLLMDMVRTAQSW